MKTVAQRVLIVIALAIVTQTIACGTREVSVAAGDAAATTDAGATGGGIDDGPADGGGVGFPGVNVAITDEPLSIAFTYKGAPLVALSAAGSSALYLTDGTTKVGLSGPVTQTTTADAVILDLFTGDGRAARVEIGPAAEDAARVRFFVEKKKKEEKYGAAFSVGAQEGFYGVMERVVQGDDDSSWKPGMTEGLNLRGQYVYFFVMATVSIFSPFFVSSAGYGVYTEGSWPGAYDFGRTDPAAVAMEFEGDELVFRVIPGPAPLDVSRRYARTAGLPKSHPRWVFGPWRYRDEDYNLRAFYDGTLNATPFNSMVVEDVLMMEALGIPLSLRWLDRPWCPGYFGYNDLEWDEKRFPSPLDMIKWLEGKGIKLALWIAPWAMGKMGEEAVEKGYAVDNPVPTFPADAYLLDLTNAEGVEWWQDRLALRINEGVAAFKLDRGEEKPPDGIAFAGKYDNGMTYREGHNLYPLLYAEAVHGAFTRAGVDEFAIMPRSGWVGTSRHAISWGGDTGGTEWGLRSVIIALQRAAVMNFPVWGSDTCGYVGMASHETCARWLAFSAFCPLMEVGPTRNASLWSRVPDGESGGVDGSGYHYTPYYDESLVAAWIFYARLHHDLMDYTHAQAELAHEDGTPIVRPMVVMHPGIPEFTDMFDQYYFGPDIVVAPIWQTGVAEREVTIPPGDWIDAWTGQAMTSGAAVTVDAPEHKIPIYYRNGSGLGAVFGDLPARWADAQARAKNRPNLAELQKTVK
ncbi:MAG: glycoside hydrolase family 31 protein [Deltaproteobacteria bacterium]|nr:glycoside hydrolase family 31 protein [Deltaproteobacteria bacterium]